MKKIKLTQGKFALVSSVDFAFLNQWKWYALKDHDTCYAVRHGPRPNRKLIRMHRVILQRMGYVNFKETDHCDKDGLNNQRCNLRPATHQQNNFNKKIRSDNSSGYKGVSWSKLKEKWRSYITINDEQIELGYFDNLTDAAKVYNNAANKYHNEFANLNVI